MKNLILIASVEDDWHRAEKSRCEAEQIHYTADMLTESHETEVKAALKEHREDLDEIKGTQDEYAPSDTPAALDLHVQETGKMLIEDPEAVNKADAEVLGPDVSISETLREALIEEMRKHGIGRDAEEKEASVRVEADTSTSTE